MKDTCPGHRKKSYLLYPDAIVVAERESKLRRKNLYVYLCPHGNHYHITHKEGSADVRKTKVKRWH